MVEIRYPPPIRNISPQWFELKSGTTIQIDWHYVLGRMQNGRNAPTKGRRYRQTGHQNWSTGIGKTS